MPVGLSEAVRVPVNTVKIVSVAENTRQNCKEYANEFMPQVVTDALPYS